MRDALGRIRGAFSVAVVHSDEPDLIVASRRVSPLLMGVSDSAAFLASDVPAILGLTREFFVLEDDQIAELRPGLGPGHHPGRGRGGAGPADASTGTSTRPARTASTTT